ncbi:MAG: P-loop NTPase fold protein, partial [Chloroflexota bacterium]|nr:P-loop NTPase fold protein [Chloroflexota bacterium]
MTKKPTYILGDLPADHDALDFQPYIDTLADVIASPNTQTPLTIGVFGGWGSGKTTLMGLVGKGLPKNYRTAWFDAWKYERETDLWRALLLTTLDALEDALPQNEAGEIEPEAKGRLDDLRTSLYRPVEREEMGGLQVDWGKLAGGVTQGALQIGLSFVPGASTLAGMVKALQKEGATVATEKLIAAIGRERSQIFIQQVQFLEQFQREFRDLVKTYIQEKGHRLVVFVDDLDRCLPEKAVEVLEAIKLFLDVPGCVFVLGLDDKV